MNPPVLRDPYDANYDIYYGGIGNDTLIGGLAAELMLGGPDNDSIQGGGGADRLFGDAGIDTLFGGRGNDTLTGGADSDFFVFNTAFLATAPNTDLITDFNVAADTIQLENGIMTGLGATLGTLAAAKFLSGTTVTHGLDTTDRIVYNTTTGALYYDADGNGTGVAIQIATIGVSTHAALTFADFVVI